MLIRFTKIDNSITKIIEAQNNCNLYFLKYELYHKLSYEFKIPYDEIIIIKIDNNEFNTIEYFITKHSINELLINIWNDKDLDFIVSSCFIKNQKDIYTYFAGSDEQTSNKECPCCYEINKSVITPYNCRHIICKSCFNSWSEKNGNCPICRSKIKYIK